jgi:two-component system phosphate regulon sensor histidine kinase PhoR
MFWFGPRVAAAVLITLLGAVLGYGLGGLLHVPLWGTALGATAGSAMATAADVVRGARLLAWLRSPGESPPPAGGGLWGEVADRIVRAFRVRDAAEARERGRLTQFLAAIEVSPSGVLLMDANDQIEWFSRPAAEHLGLDLQRDLRQKITNLVRAPAFVQYLQTGAFEQSVQIPGPLGKGSLQLSIRPYGDGQKLLLTQDITERERADSMRRDFVANVSHEIRTPLTVLAGFVETLVELRLSEVERKRVLELMGQQTQRMQTLVGDLLTLAQLEGSPRPPNDRWVHIKQLSRPVENDARSLSGGRHSLSFQWPEGLAIAGNESELMSALGNLVTNAVRYTPDGGRIAVRWQARPDEGGEFEVVDSGIGIAREHLPRLTERFYRVDGSRSRGTGGTGLGLSIVKHVVQRHGGELLIDSELGKGSRFRLVLPASRVKVGEADRTSAEAQGLIR